MKHHRLFFGSTHRVKLNRAKRLAAWLKEHPDGTIADLMWAGETTPIPDGALGTVKRMPVPRRKVDMWAVVFDDYKPKDGYIFGFGAANGFLPEYLEPVE